MPRRQTRTWARRGAVAALIALFTAELVAGWPALTAAVSHLSAPRPGWLAAAVAAEVVAMAMYGRMQQFLLRSAGLRVPAYRNIAVAYAAHSLNETLPGGPAFSTRFNYQQMRRFGATPAVAAWCIALSGILSTTALALVTAAGALASQQQPRWYGLAGLIATVGLIIAGVRLVTRRPDVVHAPARWSLAVVNRWRRRPAEDGFDRVRGFIGQLGAARLTAGTGTAAAVLAVLNWGLDAVCLWMCLRAVTDDPINATQVLLAFCAGMAAGTITIVPGGLGIIDSALILGLVAGGHDTPAAIAAVVLYRIISFGFIIGAGWITWFLIRRRQSSEIRRRPGSEIRRRPGSEVDRLEDGPAGRAQPGVADSQFAVRAAQGEGAGVALEDDLPGLGRVAGAARLQGQLDSGGGRHAHGGLGDRDDHHPVRGRDGGRHQLQLGRVVPRGAGEVDHAVRGDLHPQVAGVVRDVEQHAGVHVDGRVAELRDVGRHRRAGRARGRRRRAGRRRLERAVGGAAVAGHEGAHTGRGDQDGGERGGGSAVTTAAVAATADLGGGREARGVLQMMRVRVEAVLNVVVRHRGAPGPSRRCHGRSDGRPGPVGRGPARW
ncbi:flippase-like domain-containing protein [Actinoplanes sp. LDG1-06]|uniref:Flippase-like domain-containing protein n=1 Tax=Paractinoplanes ovalisporus TaxID=2810368 RepID=A0ABS2AQQ9_9ACTN|nr:YbhN family protein [Actinoplanes ovalisporus]MBM2622083.1 flippase-like domain-containing protein [Actinoplanes ovalisporus]